MLGWGRVMWRGCFPGRRRRSIGCEWILSALDSRCDGVWGIMMASTNEIQMSLNRRVFITNLSNNRETNFFCIGRTPLRALGASIRPQAAG